MTQEVDKVGSLFRDTKDIEITQRAQKARTLRLAGYTYRQIADQLGVGTSTVKKDLERIKVDYPEQSIRELTAQQHERLEAMFTTHFLKACSGDTRALNGALKILDQQAKLWGLYEQEQDNGQAHAAEALASLIESVKDAATKDNT